MYDGTTVPDGVAAARSKDSFILKMSNLLPHHQVNALKASLRLSDAQDLQHHTAPLVVRRTSQVMAERNHSIRIIRVRIFSIERQTGNRRTQSHGPFFERG